MTVNMKAAPQTAAETELLSQFEQAHGTLPGSAKVISLREAAFATFREAGLPHRKVEDWKYSDLRSYLKTASPLADAFKDDASAEASLDAYEGLDRYQVTVGNGRLIAEKSDIDALAAKGVRVLDLASLLDHGEEAAELFAMPEIAEKNVAISLNAAFLQGGVVLRVADGTKLDKPLEIRHLADASGAVYTRVRCEMGKRSSLLLLETFPEGGACDENAVSDYALADGAELSAMRLVLGKGTRPHISTVIATLGESTHLKAMGFVVGTPFARNQGFVTFRGENSRAEIFGISMIRDEQHADQTLFVDHAVPHCESREYFKTVIDGHARGVFQGKIIVRPHAQKTDGQMMTQALLLSDDAEMDNKPELEIFADDVQCAHGATSGQIDEDLLFYLRARGIPEAEAKTLLILAFLSEAIEEFGADEVTEGLEERVRSWLVAGLE